MRPVYRFAVVVLFLTGCFSPAVQRSQPLPTIQAGRPEVRTGAMPAKLQAARRHERDLARARRLGIRSIAEPPGWKPWGPDNIIGRTLSLLVDSRSPAILWAGAWAGMWNSVDGGRTWTDVDKFIGRRVTAIAQDPHDPLILYAGTEGFLDTELHNPAGLYRSVDGGTTWARMDTPAGMCGIHGISIAWWNPNIILLGTDNQCGPGGIIRTGDAGRTWTTVLPTSPIAISGSTVYAKSVAEFDPRFPGRAVACSAISAGYVPFFSRDEGRSWTQARGVSPSNTSCAVTHGLRPAGRGFFGPVLPLPSVYFVGWDGPDIFHAPGRIWRSNNGGQQYTLLATPSDFAGPFWAGAVWSSQRSPNVLVVGGTLVYRSADGGRTWTTLRDPAAHVSASTPHGDIYEIHSARFGAGELVSVVTDGGIYQNSHVGTSTPTTPWGRLTGYVNTMYFDADIGPTNEVIGGMQDTGLAYTNFFETIPEFDGDVFHVASDPTDENIDYYSSLGQSIFRCVGRVFPCENISPALDRTGSGDIRFIMDPNDRNRLVAANTLIHETTDASTGSPASWRTIGSAVAGRIGALAIPKGVPNQLWAGDGFGNVIMTLDAEDPTPSWTNINATATGGLVFHGGITSIMVDPDDPNRVFVGSKYGDLKETMDGGHIWVDRSGSGATRLPSGSGAEVFSIVRHPSQPDWLYAGTGYGLYVSDDGGVSWAPVSDPVLSRVTIRELRLFPHEPTLLVATFGRGLFYADLPVGPTTSSRPASK